MMEKKVTSSTDQEPQSLLQLIIFRIGDEEFGVPIEAVQEIIKIGTITPIPDSPPFIRGLVNVRGDILAVINLKARFLLPVEESISKHIVIAKQADSVFGIMVDEVIEILRVQGRDIKAPPHLMSKINEDYVRGVITHEGRLIILLDLETTLSEDELARFAETARSQFKKETKDAQEEMMDESLLAKASETVDRKLIQKKKKNRGSE